MILHICGRILRKAMLFRKTGILIQPGRPLGESWSIPGILNHVGDAVWGYHTRIGLAIPADELPAGPDEWF